MLSIKLFLVSMCSQVSKYNNFRGKNLKREDMIGKKKARSFKALSSVGVLTVALTLYSRAH